MRLLVLIAVFLTALSGCGMYSHGSASSDAGHQNPTSTTGNGGGGNGGGGY